MNWASGDRTDDGLKRKLKDGVDDAKEKLTQLRNSVEKAKEWFSLTCEQFEKLQSSVEEMESIVERLPPDRPPAASSGCKEVPKSKAADFTTRKQMDEPSIEMEVLPTKRAASDTTPVEKTSESSKKKLRTSPDKQRIGSADTPATSQSIFGSLRRIPAVWNAAHSIASSSFSPTGPAKKPSEQAKVSDPKPSLEDTDTLAVRMALDMTKGVLPSQDLHTYLYLTSQVDDPLQLARISFTTDLRKLYYQLQAFSYHLQNINEVVVEEKGAAGVDRRLEDRLKILIEHFKDYLNQQPI